MAARDEREFLVSKTDLGNISVVITDGPEGAVLDELLLEPEAARQLRCALEKVLSGRAGHTKATNRRTGFRQPPEQVFRLSQGKATTDDPKPRHRE